MIDRRHFAEGLTDERIAAIMETRGRDVMPWEAVLLAQEVRARRADDPRRVPILGPPL